MRDDMSKLLCERPRYGGQYANKRGNRRKFNDPSSFEEAPKRTGTGRGTLYGYNRKELNEYLQPLARYLESKVGQPWDKVYSEIRKQINPNSTVQNHMEHLWSYVERFVHVADCGELVVVEPYRYRRDSAKYTVNGRGGWSSVYNVHSWRYTYLFIHPVTGILCNTKDEKKRRRQKASKKKTSDTRAGFVDGRHFVKEKGIWYELDVIPLPDGWKWGEPKSVKVTTKVVVDDKVVKAQSVKDDFGPRDCFFGQVGGTAGKGILPYRFYRRADNGTWYTPVNLAKVRETYGNLRAYCPGTKKQANSKTLNKYGLVNG